jgi:hypothetical protein
MDTGPVLVWDKTVVQTFAPERQQILYGPRWMTGAGDRPADWTVVPSFGTSASEDWPEIFSPFNF